MEEILSTNENDLYGRGKPHEDVQERSPLLCTVVLCTGLYGSFGEISMEVPEDAVKDRH